MHLILQENNLLFVHLEIKGTFNFIMVRIPSDTIYPYTINFPEFKMKELERAAGGL